jgi:hypothetical protein
MFGRPPIFDFSSRKSFSGDLLAQSTASILPHVKAGR